MNQNLIINQLFARFLIEGPNESIETLLDLLKGYHNKWEELVDVYERDSVRQEYNDLICGIRKNIPMGTSGYTEEGYMYGTETKKFADYYRLWNLKVLSAHRLPPDHFGIIFAFLAYMEYQCILRADVKEQWDKQKGSFLKEYFIRTLSEFIDKIRENTKNKFLLRLAHVMGIFIEEQISSSEEVQDLKSILEMTADTAETKLKSGVLVEAELVTETAFDSVLKRESVLAQESVLVQESVLAQESVLEQEFLLAQKTVSNAEIMTGNPISYIFEEIRTEEDAVRKMINTCGVNNCGGRCVIKAEVDNGCIVNLSSDCGDSRFGTKLTSCLRGKGYRETFLNYDRLKYPMRRVGKRGEGKFERISWEEATDIIANELTRIKKQYGAASRYINYSTGVSAVMRGDHMMKRLLSLDGGYLGYYNNYSNACTKTATRYTYGTTLSGNSPEDYIYSKLIILWGHNPFETIFGTETRQYLLKAKQAGCKFVVIDPRYNDTAFALKADWIAPRPSTDAALAHSMAYAIITRGLHNQEFLDQFCIGFDKEHMPKDYEDKESYLDYVLGKRDGIPKTPEWGEKVTGIKAKIITKLAIDYATTKPAAIIAGYGAQRQGNGEQTTRSQILLTCLTGNIGIAGGSAAGIGEVMGHALPSFPIPANPANVSIPCFLWTMAAEQGIHMTVKGDGVRGKEKLNSNIKLIISIAGNTLVNQHGDINRTVKLLQDESKVEFILCSDIFMTSSAKFADILLPGVSMFEVDNISEPWMMGDYLLYSRKIIEPIYESRPDYEWICEVAEKLGKKEEFNMGYHDYDNFLKGIYEELRTKENELPDYEVFRENGGYRYNRKAPYIAFKEQITDINGNPFPTKSGKIEIFSPDLFRLQNPQEIPAIPKYVSCEDGFEDKNKAIYPLQLIGWHVKNRCHSVHDNNPWLKKFAKPQVWIHPEDAKLRKIEDSEVVKVWNDRGTLQIEAFLTDKIARGVVAIPQGGWFLANKEGTDIGKSINVLTSQKPTPLAKGNSQHSVLVEIEKISR
ncbi:MAG: dmsA [Anaerocolumna sp.]|nr:dmsA [Anaerocolumna sp.]